jgi:hypothetical protein
MQVTAEVQEIADSTNRYSEHSKAEGTDGTLAIKTRVDGVMNYEGHIEKRGVSGTKLEPERPESSEQV